MFSSITDKINQTFNILISNASNESNENTTDYSECKFILKFRKQKLETRLKIFNDIFLKHPDRIPMIVDTRKELVIDKNKYIVPKDLTIGQFTYMLKKRLKINANDAIYLICNNKLLVNSHTVSQVYYANKDSDDFLYIIIAAENTFGNNKIIYLK